MINKRLIKTVEGSMSYVLKTVLCQWIALLMNIVFTFSIAYILQRAYVDALTTTMIVQVAIIWMVVIIVRFLCHKCAALMGYYASHGVKKTLREKIYQKILQLGMSYQRNMSTSEVVQVAMEGVEQLEIYFSKYLPQFIYSMLAPITLFLIFCFINIKTAVVLLICVPLIPLSIIAVQKFAKRLLSKYWGAYTTLGDSFLENLQGLTTLKIYQADDYKTIQMDKEAETFRKVTMKVLTMQLNSISVMDIVAFGGAALGMILAIHEFQAGHVSFIGMVMIILLSSEFFIPLRLLGSFFHIAMNGMAASDKIFRILDMDNNSDGTIQLPKEKMAIKVANLNFSYEENEPVLHTLDFELPSTGMYSFAGKSGCGKSTLASILSGHQREYEGSIQFNGQELSTIKQDTIMQLVTVVNHDGYLFAGTLRYNLLMVDDALGEEAMWKVLEKVQIADFVKEQGGLNMPIMAQGSNLSGGQKQRILLARALLKDSPIYIFDEATSNIDVESENAIINVIYQLQKTKTVILITHRLDNGVEANKIYMMENGKIIESGTHNELDALNGAYASMYKQQAQLLSIYNQEVNNHE